MLFPPNDDVPLPLPVLVKQLTEFNVGHVNALFATAAVAAT